MDLQWILDRLFDAGKIAAAHNTQIEALEADVDDLKKLYDRVLKLETREQEMAKRDDRGPQHRLVWISAIGVTASVAAVVVSVIALLHR